MGVEAALHPLTSLLLDPFCLTASPSLDRKISLAMPCDLLLANFRSDGLGN